MRGSFVRLTLKVAACIACYTSAHADFKGLWAPANWSFTNGGGNGAGALTETVMVIIGNDNGMPNINTEYSIKAPFDVKFQFQWIQIPKDEGCFDFAYYRIDNALKTIVCNNGLSGGLASADVKAGQEFGIGVRSTDGSLGPMTFWVSSFVPEPSSLVLLILGAVLISRHRR
jgi:hypothetical protein